MRSNSSRMHSLERSLKDPPKSRARGKVRALTVLRLEGATGRASVQHVPAKLPRDLEDHIAVVRGRAASRPSRGLLQLEERLLRIGEMETRAPVIQRYDHGASPATVPAPPVVNQARALSAEPPLGGSAFGGRFNVESFEETSVPAVGQVIGLPSTDYTVFPPADAGVKTELNAVTPQAATGVPPRVDTVGGAPWAGAQSRADRARVLNAEQKAVAENFQRDLAATLGDSAPRVGAPEDKQWDGTLRSMAQTTPPASTNIEPQPTPAPTPVEKVDAHKVFNQMGLAMNYANSFDLGAVDLSARFDQFERELALETKPAPTAAAPAPVKALELDDFDLVADLATLSGTQAAAALPPEAKTEPGASGAT